jgi:Tfp pilus assembly protein PilF
VLHWIFGPAGPSGSSLTLPVEPFSPFSVITVPEYIQRRVQENSPQSLQEAMKFAPTEYVEKQIEEKALESLQEAVTLAPTNGLALARLARAILAQSRVRIEAGWQSQWLTRRAVEFAPGEAQAWRARAEFAERAGNLSEALEAIKRP